MTQTVSKAATAGLGVFMGIRLCLTDAKLRRLSLIPILIGAIVYILAAIGIYFGHGPLVSLIIDEPTTWWWTLVYYPVWAFCLLALIFLGAMTSLIVTMIASGPAQSAIARHLLEAAGYEIPIEQGGLTGTGKEAARTAWVEGSKFLWLLPVTVSLFVVGFFPFVAPLVFIAAGWILGFQFVDNALDIFKLGVFERFRFCARHGVLTAVFGMVLSLLWVIPFIGIFLTPTSAAGATWALIQTGVLLGNDKVRLKEAETPSG